jgi:hypothetical protein
MRYVMLLVTYSCVALDGRALQVYRCEHLRMAMASPPTHNKRIRCMVGYTLLPYTELYCTLVTC